MACDVSSIPELDHNGYDADEQVKIICLGDSAVGKSKWVDSRFHKYSALFWQFSSIHQLFFPVFRRLMERFLMDK